MELKMFLTLIGQYGLPIALVVYFVWRDYVREQRAVMKEAELISHIQSLEAEMRQLLIEMVNKTTGLIMTNHEIMKDFASIMTIRPCLADELAKKMVKEAMELAKENNKK
jgi:hypothetical protein